MRISAAAAAVLMCMSSSLGAQTVHPNDYGEIGLLQTPTARLAADGEFRLGVSLTYPYNALLFSTSIFPFLETGFRYSQVNNREFGTGGPVTNQSNKDRALDLKLRLKQESQNWPQIALGIRDFGGTGLFAGEYLVASRRFYDFDFSLGLGWGRLGARGGIRNPLSFLSSKFDTRSASTGLGGVPKFGDFFSGREVSLFGGVAWNTPIRHLSVLLEYDGNDYQSEALNNNQPVRFPINFAASYTPWPWLFLSLGLERGDRATARILLRTNFEEVTGIPKINDPPLPGWSNAGPTESRPLLADDIEKISNDLKQQGIVLQALDQNPENRELSVWVSRSSFPDEARPMGRALRILSRHAPQNFNYFNVVETSRGLPLRKIGMLRKDAEATFSGVNDLSEVVRRVDYAGTEVTPDTASQPALAPQSSFNGSMGPDLRQHVGGPDAFYFYQIFWAVRGEFLLTPQWNISSAVGFDISNNFDGLTNLPTSDLPHVRSEIVQYLKEGRNSLIQLESNYVGALAKDLYWRLSAGIFEQMYGGVAGEVLYRPLGRSWALGVDLNRVRQRTFKQRLDFLDYEVTTGHLTAYWKIPDTQIQVKLSAGQYLAGDRGVTLDVSRRFSSGIQLGAFATKTNVSAAQFGEGSFDKGFYLGFPFDLFFTKSSRDYRVFTFKPLTRDGGQKVRDGESLYSLTDVGAGTVDAVLSPGFLK